MAAIDKQTSAIVVFESQKIRREWHQEEWWFSVVDVVEVLTDSVNSRDYWYRMKVRVEDRESIKIKNNSNKLFL